MKNRTILSAMQSSEQYLTEWHPQRGSLKAVICCSRTRQACLIYRPFKKKIMASNPIEDDSADLNERGKLNNTH